MAYRIEEGANKFPLRNEVYQSNPLINARKSFDLMGMRIFILGLRGLNPHFSKKDKFFDEEFKETFIPSSELTQLFQNTGYLSEMKSACRKLLNTTIEIKNSAGELTLTHIFKKLEYDPRKGLHLKFDDEMRPYLLNLAESGGYTMIKADYLFKLSSPYAMRLLELLLQYQNFRMFRELKEVRRKFTFDELKYLLNVPENAYKGRPDNFKKYVLDIPIKEITERTPYRMHYKAVKNGRTLYAFEFFLDVFNAPVEILNTQRTYFGEAAISRLCELGFSEKAAQDIYLKCDNTKDCLNRINRANLILLLQKNPIENKLGFLRRAIEGNWQMNGKRPPPKQKQPDSPLPIQRKKILKLLRENQSPTTDTRPEIPEAPSEKSKVVEIVPQRNFSEAPPPTKEKTPKPEPKTYSLYDEETTRTYTDHKASTPEAAETKKSRPEESDTISLDEIDSIDDSPESKLAAHRQIFDTLMTIKHLMLKTLDERVRKEEIAETKHEPPPPLTEEETTVLNKIVEIMDKLPTILALTFMSKKNLTPEIIEERKYIIMVLQSLRNFRPSILDTFKVPYADIKKGTNKLSADIKILENSIRIDNNAEMMQLLKPLLDSPDYKSNPLQALDKFLKSLSSFSSDDDSNKNGVTSSDDLVDSMEFSSSNDSSSAVNNDKADQSFDAETPAPSDDDSEGKRLTTFGELFGSMKFSSSNDSSSNAGLSFDTKKQPPNDDASSADNNKSSNSRMIPARRAVFPETDGFHTKEEILAMAEEASRSIDWTIREPPLPKKHPTLPDVSVLLATLHYRKFPKPDLTAEDIASLARTISLTLDTIDEHFEEIGKYCLAHREIHYDDGTSVDRKKCIFLKGKFTEDLLDVKPSEVTYVKDMDYLSVLNHLKRIRRGDFFFANENNEEPYNYMEGFSLKVLDRYFDMTYMDFLRMVIKRLILNKPTSYEIR